MKRCRFLSVLLIVALITCLLPSSNVNAKKIGISDKKIILYPGGEYELSVANNKNVSWKSSNESVATVDDGIVTGVSLGTATITAERKGKKYKCKVTVEESVTFNWDLDEYSEYAASAISSKTKYEDLDIDEDNQTITLTLPKSELEKADKQIVKEETKLVSYSYDVVISDDCKTCDIYEIKDLHSAFPDQKSYDYVVELPRWMTISLLPHMYIHGVTYKDVTYTLHKYVESNDMFPAASNNSITEIIPVITFEELYKNSEEGI